MHARRQRLMLGAAGAALGLCAAASATDIYLVQPAALDQPRVNAYLRLPGNTYPQTFEDVYNISAFLDTGASGVLLSNNTADLLGIARSTYIDPQSGMQQYVVFSDIGVAGSDDFHVSGPLHIGIAPYDPAVSDLSDYVEHPLTVRTQIGPINVVDPNPLLENLDVFGTPLMQGKVVVMNPRPVNTFWDTIRTYVYTPGEPVTIGPGIPSTSLHVKLSHADFRRFTQTVPAGESPTLAVNPFIGPDPVAAMSPNPPPDDTPPVTVTFGNRSFAGSWLLDTGAAASILSKTAAEQHLGVRYRPGTFGTTSPELVDELGNTIPDQFALTIGGIGGTTKLAGFYLDTLTLVTQEALAQNNPSLNIRYVGAPVLVGDITVRDPLTDESLTLDGIFGMNFLVASAFVTEAEPFPIIDNLRPGNFSWVVYDQPNATLGLETAAVNEQTTQYWYGAPFGTSYWNTTDDNWYNDTGGLYRDGDFVVFADVIHTWLGDIPIASRFVTIPIGQPVAPGSVLFDNTWEDYVISGDAIRGYTGLTKRGTGTVRFLNSNTYSGPTSVLEGTVEFVAPQNIGPVNVYAGATVVMQSSQRFKSLNIAGGLARFTSGGASVLDLDAITVIDDGVLDLADDAMIVRSGSAAAGRTLSEVEALVAMARNAPGGRWAGPGITSSAAAADPRGLMTLGVMLNDDGTGRPVHEVFRGVDADAGCVLVMYTLAGDADLSGVIDAADYFRIDQGYLSGGRHWRDGDFDYSGAVDADDYYLIDAAFLAQQAGYGKSAAPIPEPSCLLWAAMAGAVAGRRRPRRSGS